jgi:hypothetical protein
LADGTTAHLEDIRTHADEREIAATLPDDFMAGGKGNQMTETLRHNGIAVVNEFGDRFTETADKSHPASRGS